MQAVIFLVAAVVVCLLLLTVLKQRGEPFANHTQAWSNGNVTPESVKLEAAIRALNPTIWMDGETFQQNTWLDKSGKGNDSVNARNLLLDSQNSSAHGCNAAFKFITGKKANGSNLRLGNGWPQHENYTFFHVTRYNGPEQRRIWQAVPQRGINWLSGHWGGLSQRFYHGSWLQQGKDRTKNQYRWQLSSDRWDQTRSLLAGHRRVQSGRLNPIAKTRHERYQARKAKRPINSVAVGTDGGHSREASDWACAEVILFDTRLSDADVRQVERYLEIKYGFH